MGVDRADVAIVGAGPAGAAAATWLARAGLRVVMIDRCRFPRPRLCGGFVGPEAAHLLAALSAGGPAPPHVPIRNVNVTSGRRGAFSGRLPVAGSLPASAAPSGRQPPGEPWGIERSSFDAWIVDRARDAGAELIEGAAIEELIFDSAGPAGTLETTGGIVVSIPGSAHARRSIRASVLLAADGRHSKTARLLAASVRAGRRTHRARLRLREFPRHAFQAIFDAPGAPEDAVELHFFPGGYVGLQPAPGGGLNVCGIVTAEWSVPSGRNLDDLLGAASRRNARLASRLERARRSTPWQAAGGLSFGPRVPVRSGVLFVGDSAGTVEPFTGGGLAMALTSAALASRALVETPDADGVLSAAAEAYASRWRSAFDARFRLCGLIGRCASQRQLLAVAIGLLGRVPSVADRLVLATRGPAAAARAPLPPPDAPGTA